MANNQTPEMPDRHSGQIMPSKHIPSSRGQPPANTPCGGRVPESSYARTTYSPASYDAHGSSLSPRSTKRENPGSSAMNSLAEEKPAIRSHYEGRLDVSIPNNDPAKLYICNRLQGTTSRYHVNLSRINHRLEEHLLKEKGLKTKMQRKHTRILVYRDGLRKDRRDLKKLGREDGKAIRKVVQMIGRKEAGIARYMMEFKRDEDDMSVLKEQGEKLKAEQKNLELWVKRSEDAERAWERKYRGREV